ncbi:hypothetical protein Tco_1154469 [Tanacetum coccineum]
MSEARMREIIKDQVTVSMNEFVANMNRGADGDGAGGAGAGGAGAGGAKAGSDGAGGAGAGGVGAGGAGAGGDRAGGAGAGGAGAGGAGADSDGASGAGASGAGAGGAEVGESVFRISDCKEKDKVKFVTAILQGRALTWWNGRITSMGIDAANGTDIDGYTNRFHELALLCPRMVEPEQVKVEKYIRGLSKNIRGDVTSSRPTGIDDAIRMAYQLMGQIIQNKTNEVSEGEKRKGEGDRGGRGDNRHDYNHRQTKEGLTMEL